VTTLEERHQQGARAQQIAKRIMRRTGLDEAAAMAAARIELGLERPSFVAQTIEGPVWREDERYPRWVLPTAQMSKEWRDPRSRNNPNPSPADQADTSDNQKD
jgi:hypothetical protein